MSNKAPDGLEEMGNQIKRWWDLKIRTGRGKHGNLFFIQAGYPRIQPNTNETPINKYFPSLSLFLHAPWVHKSRLLPRDLISRPPHPHQTHQSSVPLPRVVYPV